MEVGRGDSVEPTFGPETLRCAGPKITRQLFEDIERELCWAGAGFWWAANFNELTQYRGVSCYYSDWWCVTPINEPQAWVRHDQRA